MMGSGSHNIILNDLLLCRFGENGNGPDEYNCWNLCREVYRRAGRQLPQYSEYIRDIFERDKAINEFRKIFFKKIKGPEFLAIVTLKLRPRCITHMGCVISGRRFIHINKHAGVCMPELADPKWKNKIEGFYRYAGQ